MEFLFPEYRLNWFDAGPSSPNKTGALLAIIFIAAWWPALRFRWGYWLSLPVAIVAMGFLLQTESRGALVGAAGGSVVLLGSLLFSVTCLSEIGRAARLSRELAKRRRHADKQRPYVLWVRALTLLLALGLLFIYAQQLGVNNRMAAIASGEDGSSNVRVALYSAGMEMIADAPFGWGHGQAGNAYGQWYQEIGDSRSYLSLVNSHLTWMADYGMVFQFFYIAGWVLVFLLCWPFVRRSGVYNPLRVLQTWSREHEGDAASVASLREIGGSDPTRVTPTGSYQDATRSTSSGSLTSVASLRLITFASWIVLILCGVFSSVLTLVWLWVIPCALLLLCLFQRIRSNNWPSKRQSQIACLTVILAFFGLQSAAHAFAWGNQITVNSESIELGKAPKTVAILQPDRKIVGDKYGHTIREYLEDVEGVTVLRKDSAQADVNTFETVVFSGSLPQMKLAPFAGRLVWLNPPANVDDATLESFSERTLTIVVGSLGDWRRVRLWQALTEENTKWSLIELRGVADFIPGWPKYLRRDPDSENRGHTESFEFDRSRVALAPDLERVSGTEYEQGAAFRPAQAREANLLRCEASSSFWLKRIRLLHACDNSSQRIIHVNARKLTV